MVFQKPEQVNREIINNYEPFLYKLVGTWAFAPHPKRWREFLDWFHSVDNEKFDPYVPGLLTSDWLHMHTSMGKRHMTWVSQHKTYCSFIKNSFDLTLVHCIKKRPVIECSIYGSITSITCMDSQIAMVIYQFWTIL